MIREQLETTVAARPNSGYTRLDPWLCSIVPVVCVLLAHPFVEVGLNDDFSFARTAWIFARTGHFRYFGWGEMPLGWQVVWAAPFVRIFGPTYAAVRISNLVLFFLTLFLFHAVLRRCALGREQAAFGTLVLGLSPILLPVSGTFMTDTGSILATVACLYSALRVVQAESDRSRLLWLSAGFLAGAIGGTSRQTTWVAAITLLGTAAWLRRRQRSLPIAAYVLGVLTVAFAVFVTRWYHHQPFHQSEPLLLGSFSLSMSSRLVKWTVDSFFCLLLTILPVGAYGAVRNARTRLWQWPVLLGAAVVAAWCAHHFTRSLPAQGWAPWLEGIIVFLIHGELGAAVPQWISPALSVLVFFFLFLFLWNIARSHGNPEASESSATRTTDWPELLVLLGVFTIAYVGLLAMRVIWIPIFDRYILPLSVVGIIVALHVATKRIPGGVGALAWIVLAAMGYCSMAGLHDWAAEARARQQAVQLLNAAGIPDTRMYAGFSIDGVTEIDARGGLSAPGSALPAGFDTTIKKPAGLPSSCDFFDAFVPAVYPDYVLRYSPGPCLEPSRYRTFPYRRWLPFGSSQSLQILKYTPDSGGLPTR